MSAIDCARTSSDFQVVQINFQGKRTEHAAKIRGNHGNQETAHGCYQHTKKHGFPLAEFFGYRPKQKDTQPKRRLSNSVHERQRRTIIVGSKHPI